MFVRVRRAGVGVIVAGLVGLPAGSAVSAGPGVAGPAPTPDRVAVLRQVAVSSPTSAQLRAMGALARAKALARCFGLGEVRYCLGQGFTEVTPDYAALAKAPTSGTRGDLSFGVWAARRAALSDGQRVKVEQAEVGEALEALPGVLRLRSAVDSVQAGRAADGFEGLVPLPANSIMKGKQTRQERSNWCGPATMQSIGWYLTGKKESQATWAKRLGTGASGTEITRMVAQLKAIDKRMGRKGRTHQVVKVNGMSPAEFYTIHRVWIGWKAKGFEPVIEHPKLIRSSFDYLKFNHSGHFQVGRGYRQVGKMQMIKIFEVFNERDYNTRGNVTWGPQEVEAWRMLDATKANVLHKNFGL